MASSSLGSRQNPAYRSTMAPARGPCFCRYAGAMRRPSDRTAALVVTTLALFVDSVLYCLLVPLLPRYAQELNLNQRQLGVLFGSYAVALLLATFPLARITDRCGRRAPMLWGLGGLVFTTLAFALSRDYWLLVLARSLQGVAGAATWLPGMALLADHFPRAERGKAMGIAFAGANVGVLVGPPLAGFMDQAFGPLAPFGLGISLVVLDALARIFLLQEVEPLHEPPIPWRVLFRNRVVLVFAGAMVLGAAFWTLLESALPMDLAKRFGLGSGGIGLVFALAALGHTVTSPMAGRLSDRLGRTKVLRLGLLSALVILPMPAFLPWTWAIALAMVILGINSSLLMSPCSPAVADQIEGMQSQSFASGFSVLNIAYSVGMMAGPLLGGVLVDAWGLGVALAAMGLCCAGYLLATRGLSA
jgi:MFS transporter, DHA1 family, solute carrier family 18 (vesicular amine transporter), member 1/2